MPQNNQFVQPRRYRYVGPPEIKQSVRRESHCIQVASAGDLLSWAAEFLDRAHDRDIFTVTYIIDTEERLWIADRRSEHVACADGQDVLAAGEMVFECTANHIHAAEVSNLSTGYCPEPSCWTVVVCVLERLGIPRPQHFTPAFEFRRCAQCSTTNVIKEGIFECVVCNTALDSIWNFGNFD